MADSAQTILAWLAVCLAVLPLTLVVGNLLLLRRLPRAEFARKISVLIPARDEAENIGAAIESVLANRSGNFELLVLDDDTRVLPGHGESSTIGLERRSNPFLQGLVR